MMVPIHKRGGVSLTINGKLHDAQDEVACIGCKQCVWIAQGTFRIEPDHGRSRVFAQWVDTEDDIQVREGCAGFSTAGCGTPFTLA